MPLTTLPVSVFYNVRAPGAVHLPQGSEADWPSDFLTFVGAATSDEKLDVPAYIPGVFRPGKGREKGRTEDNLAHMTALVLDYDGGVAIEAADAALSEWERAVYTTYRHSAADPRFRVVLPLAQPVQVSDFVRLQTAFHAWLQEQRVPCNALPPSQVYFLATKRTDLDNAPIAFHRSGALLDPSRWVAAAPVTPSRPRPAAPPPRSPSPSSGGLFSGIEDAGLESLERIEAKCAFMARARSDAATLPEPEWRAWLSVLIRCKDGRKHAHAIGKAHPGYSETETDAKWARLEGEITGPLTCEAIRSLSPACQGCPLGAPVGATTSPVQLGRPDPTTTPPEEYAADALARAERAITDARQRHAAAQAEVEEASRTLADVRERRQIARKFANSPEQAAEAGVAVTDAQRALDVAKQKLGRESKILASAERDYARQQQTAAAGGRVDIAGQLAASERGVPYGSRSNVETILDLDPAFANIRYDTFAERIFYGEIEAGELDGEKASDIERRYGIPEVRLGVFREALVTVARRREFHPVRDYLDSLRWDGRTRLDRLMIDGFGGQGSADYLDAAGTKLCIGAVARVYQPGCKVDEVVVLTGREGARKSSGLRALAAGWFSDAHVDMRSKDGLMAIAGVWIYELGELDSVQRAESTTVKRFISTQEDRYRPPYSAAMKDRKRQGILVGTTNEREFLGKDGHGDRRFVPVPTDGVHVEWIEEHRDQLWAEAKVLYERGVRWHYTAEDYARLFTAQADHKIDHPWLSLVRAWILSGTRDHPDFVDPREVLTSPHGIAKPPHLLKHGDFVEVGKVLKALGCDHYRPPPGRDGTRPGRLYRIPDALKRKPGSGTGTFGDLPAAAATAPGQVLAFPHATNNPEPEWPF